MHWEVFLIKLLILSMRDDLSRGDGHLHRQSESEVCDGVHLCINVTAENICYENLVDILPNLKDWDSYESLPRTRSVSACEYHYTERIDVYPLGNLMVEALRCALGVLVEPPWSLNA